MNHLHPALRNQEKQFLPDRIAPNTRFCQQRLTPRLLSERLVPADKPPNCLPTMPSEYKHFSFSLLNNSLFVYFIHTFTFSVQRYGFSRVHKVFKHRLHRFLQKQPPCPFQAFRIPKSVQEKIFRHLYASFIRFLLITKLKCLSLHVF